MKRLMLVVLIGAFLVLSGCGGRTKVQTETRTTTTGQELIDLDKAYKDGIISEEEYKKQREQILKGKR